MKLIGFYHPLSMNVNRKLMLMWFRRFKCLSSKQLHRQKFSLYAVNKNKSEIWTLTSGKFEVSSSVLCYQHSSAQQPSTALWPDPLSDKNISWTPACADGRSAWLVTTRCLLEEASVMERQFQWENSVHRTNGWKIGEKHPEVAAADELLLRQLLCASSA